MEFITRRFRSAAVSLSAPVCPGAVVAQTMAKTLSRLRSVYLPVMLACASTSIWAASVPPSVQAVGGNPQYVGVVQGPNGILYGATTSGLPGSEGGVLYSVSAANGYSVLHAFGRSPQDGASPNQSLFLASDNNFYGTTTHGGANGCGILFRLTPQGDYTLLHSFVCKIEGGGSAAGSLTQGSDGQLYGTARAGGAQNAGTLFKATLRGEVTVLHSFAGPDGSGPDGSLLQLGAYFYGTANTGGAANLGVVYRVNAKGEFEKLHDFMGPDGAQPNAGLAVGDEGRLYGTTTLGGAGNHGTVFSIDGAGRVATVHKFTGADGNIPSAATLLRDQNGSFYGSTAYGGNRNFGVLYRVREDGMFQKLHDFDGEHGSNPGATLSFGSDHNIYGTTGNGGAKNSGTIYQFTLDGQFTPLLSFSETVQSQRLATDATDVAQMAQMTFLAALLLGGLLGDDSKKAETPPHGSHWRCYNYGQNCLMVSE